MTLSPAAQAVIDAVYAVPLVDQRLCRNEVAVRTAAALRAAVEQSARRIFPGLSVIDADDILAIATELDAAP